MASIRSCASAILLALPTALGASAKLLVSHYNGNLYSLSLTTSGTTGQLAVKQSLKAGGTMPSWLTLDSDTGNLWVTDESTGGSPVLTQLSVGSDGTMKITGTSRSNGGEVHSAIYGGADGKGFIAAAEYDPSSISTWKLPITGNAQAVQKMTFTMNGRGPNASRQDKPHPHSVLPDPTGKFLLSPDLGADLIRIFSIDATSGKLTACTAAQAGPGDGPRHGAFWQPKPGSTDGTMLYVVNELGNSVTVWKVTYPSGGGCLSLTKTQAVSTYPAGKTPPNGCKAAEVHTWGNFVYAVNRNDKSFGSTSDSAASYSISPDTGAITFMEATNADTYYPRTFQINKAGDMVAFGGQTSSTVAIVARNTTTGRLGPMITSLLVGTAGVPGNEDGLSAVIWDE
ncbi:Lactonase, 7-bladed beta-propeller-domain-containing protein [Diplogelasinospora grovesii]|uniref:Lactonase, 7-bladed beta-propeller-domain-containing protein n=1 Tax=Diplogelasinospora grovesii TaxID=303347 RepID=A0AAN6S154_9PEZI|nr:Lactonase, 7-bladed beta-propeller-domain-containing protein [Diplogelasinospora grovesii]